MSVYKKGSATILVAKAATLLQLSFGAVSFPWYIYKKQEDGDMSPSSLVCCWTWGVCPLFLFVCRLRSTINLPVRHIHAGCALYRSIVNIVEVEYRRTSIYTQNVIKKKKMGYCRLCWRWPTSNSCRSRKSHTLFQKLKCVWVIDFFL